LAKSICLICNNEFESKRPNKKYCSPYCEYKAFVLKNPDYFKNHNKKWRNKLSEEVFDHYSKGTLSCAKCGFNDIRALSIDHINGGGTKEIHRIQKEGDWFYIRLRKEKFPEGYQVLCMNCQFIKRHENKEYRGKAIEYIKT
jgi:hypothetical protein